MRERGPFLRRRASKCRLSCAAGAASCSLPSESPSEGEGKASRMEVRPDARGQETVLLRRPRIDGRDIVDVAERRGGVPRSSGVSLGNASCSIAMAEMMRR